MAREVIWTEPAWDDLEAAAEYIARDSEFYAAALVQEARRIVARRFCGTRAGSSRIRRRFNQELLIGAYRLVYKLTDQHVFVVAFIHGARRLWRP
jgi:toxin ParE1/3/4